MEFLAIGLLSLASGSMGYYFGKGSSPPVSDYYKPEKPAIIPPSRPQLLKQIEKQEYNLKDIRGLNKEDLQKKILQLRPIPENVRSIISPMAKFESSLIEGKLSLKPVKYNM